MTLQDILKWVAVPGFAVALAMITLGFINITPSWNYVSGYIPDYLSFLSSEVFLLLGWIIVLAGVVYTLVSLYYRPIVRVFEKIKPDEKGMNFFGYISAFVFFELATSWIASATGAVPSLGVSNNIAPVVYGISSVVFSVLMQLIVVYPLLLLFNQVRKRSPGFTQNQSDAAVLLVSFPIDGAIGYFTGMFTGFGFTFLLTVLIMSYICIKTGFLKSFLTNMTINMISVSSYLYLDNAVVNTVLAIYLFVWAFLGVFWASGLAFARVPQKMAQEGQGEPGASAEGPGDLPPENLVDLWIRSTCPACGEAKFHVETDLSLKCEKCGMIIQKDQVGIQNIVVQARRIYNR